MNRAAAPKDTIELRAMAAVAFLVFYINYMVAPLLPALSREFSVTTRLLGWLVAGFSIAYGISTLIYGVLSDRVGRSPVLLMLLVVASITTFMISFAATAQELIALRVLAGVGSGGMVTISLASIGDRYPYVVQGRPMGWIFGAIAAGMGLGSSLGPILNPLIGWRNEFRALACGFALVGVVLWRCWCRSGLLHPRRETHPYRKIASEYLRILDTPRGGRTIVFILCNGIFHGGVFAWLGVLIAHRYHYGDLGIGMALAGYGLPDLLFGGFIGGWADRYGRRYVVPLGFLWAGACAFLLALPVSSWLAAFIITALSIGFEATHPLMSSIATSLDPKHRGQVTGLATFTKFLGMGAGALIFQRLIGRGFSTALIVFAMAEITFGLAAAYGFRRESSAKRASQGRVSLEPRA
ncbi:MAG TPA: MFS transporter [Acidobacteriaceae bacterium]|nr:MFS transporter [Acidobacteriaceae bacterium]